MEAKTEAQEGRLFLLPGETVESCALELGATSKTVGSSMAQLLTAANQGGHQLECNVHCHVGHLSHMVPHVLSSLRAHMTDHMTAHMTVLTCLLDMSPGGSCNPFSM